MDIGHRRRQTLPVWNSSWGKGILQGITVCLVSAVQGRHQLLESGTAIEHHWCSPTSADGGRDERGLTPPLVRGVLGDQNNNYFDSSVGLIRRWHLGNGSTISTVTDS